MLVAILGGHSKLLVKILTSLNYWKQRSIITKFRKCRAPVFGQFKVIVVLPTKSRKSAPFVLRDPVLYRFKLGFDSTHWPFPLLFANLLFSNHWTEILLLSNHNISLILCCFPLIIVPYLANAQKKQTLRQVSVLSLEAVFLEWSSDFTKSWITMKYQCLCKICSTFPVNENCFQASFFFSLIF